ncbi:MbnP family protein [Ruegeria conchae]|uniref:MbnP family protein n=1 Tax=Ruegeria conchae TaxID=981384 RepID=UPI0029C6E1E1|nr:MbnP family protein [Ruegeria conchae]
MKRLNRLSIVAVSTLVLAAIIVFAFDFRTKPRPLKLIFVAEANGEPIEFDTFAYTNPGGTEMFRLRDFRVYISNIKLADGDKVHVVENSYHLLRFDRSTPQFNVVLPKVPLRQISRISMSIGIDEAANGSIEVRGDLDPNNRMAWNWNIGYKFVLVEGAIQMDGAVMPLVYHVGFNENRRDLDFVASTSVERDENRPLTFSVDVMKLFSGEEVIDMTELQTVKMDRSDAALLATNYAQMINPTWGD